MCPAANGDALGGTPAASAASGGHIKKSAGWVHVFDAFSVHVFRLLAEKALSQVSTAKNSEEEADAEDDRVSIQEAVESDGEAEDDEGPGQNSVHDLFPSGLGRRTEIARFKGFAGEKKDGGAALAVAAPADRLDQKRLRVIAVVVVAGLVATVSAGQRANGREFSTLDRSSYRAVCGMAAVVLEPELLAAHAEATRRIGEVLGHVAAFAVTAGHGSGFLLLKLRKHSAFDDLQIHKASGWNRPLFTSLGVDSKPLRHGLRTNLTELGDLAGSTKGLNDVG